MDSQGRRSYCISMESLLAESDRERQGLFKATFTTAEMFLFRRDHISDIAELAQRANQNNFTAL